MKKTILFIAAVLISGFVHAQTESEVIRLSEPVMSNDDVEVFGSDMDLTTVNSAVSLSDAISAGADENEVLIKAEVSKVCQKKGCFFIAQDGDKQARVSFIDYSFFIPTDATGKELVFRGVLEEKELSEEQAKHYAEDAGENADAISGPQKEYSIVATSVLVPKK